VSDEVGFTLEKGAEVRPEGRLAREDSQAGSYKAAIFATMSRSETCNILELLHRENFYSSKMRKYLEEKYSIML